MRRRLPVLLALLGVLAGAPAARAATPLAAALDAQMRRAGGAAGALVVDAATGRTIYARRAGVRRMPASVEKLWTTSAALRALGPAFRLSTRTLAAGTLDEAGVLRGNLFLRGGGDPTLGRYGVHALARDLRALGVRRVTGAVVGDEGWLDARRGVPSSGYGWSPDVEPLSALTYRRNAAGSRYVPDPPRTAARALAAALAARGVRVAKGARAGRTPRDARRLVALSSLPLATIVRRTNTPSDNLYAETLVKVLGRLRGRGGSTPAGAAVVRAHARALGAAPRILDGSGLSRADASSPRQVVTLLRAMDAEPAFVASLAVAGRTGTLADRMRGTAARDRCRAKTGTLRDVSALAGYCRTRTGRTLAFAVLMNAVWPTAARRLQDRMAVAMVTRG